MIGNSERRRYHFAVDVLHKIYTPWRIVPFLSQMEIILFSHSYRYPIYSTESSRVNIK